MSCYPGFGIVEDTCLPGVSTSQYDPNCNTFDGNICTKCSKGFYLGQDSKCKRVNPSCKTYNPSNGFCTSCYAGYEVSNGLCVVGKSQPVTANCNEIDPITNLCVKCSFGYYFDSFGNCVQQSPNCKTFDTAGRVCVQCYPGY